MATAWPAPNLSTGLQCKRSTGGLVAAAGAAKQDRHVEIPDMAKRVRTVQVPESAGPCHGADCAGHSGLHLVCCRSSNIRPLDVQRCSRQPVWEHTAGTLLHVAGEWKGLVCWADGAGQTSVLPPGA